MTPPAPAQHHSPARSCGGSFLAGLVLGLAVGFGAGVLVSAKGCPPDPVPAAAPQIPEAPKADAPAPAPAKAPEKAP